MTSTISQSYIVLLFLFHSFSASLLSSSPPTARRQLNIASVASIGATRSDNLRPTRWSVDKQAAFAVSYVSESFIKDHQNTAFYSHSNVSCHTFPTWAGLCLTCNLNAHDSLHNGFSGWLYCSTQGPRGKYKLRNVYIENEHNRQGTSTVVWAAFKTIRHVTKVVCHGTMDTKKYILEHVQALVQKSSYHQRHNNNFQTGWNRQEVRHFKGSVPTFFHAHRMISTTNGWNFLDCNVLPWQYLQHLFQVQD